MPIARRSSQATLPAQTSGVYRAASGDIDFDDFSSPKPPLALDLESRPLPAMWAKSGSGLHHRAPESKDPKPGIVAFAGYGIPPEKLAATPSYAIRVIARKHSLRSDLEIARLRRLPKRDVELYEAALSCANEAAVTKGIAVIVTTFAGMVGAIAAAVALLF